jgi:hypothetical protein
MDSSKQHLEHRIRTLMEQQRTLAVSGNPLERAFGTLIVAAQLRQYLACLNDRNIGRLMFKHVWDALSLTTPEMTITIEATRRLSRSQKENK